MTRRGRKLADMMEQRNVDILCLQETKWKGSKARNIGGGCKIFYNGVDGRKNGIGIVVREDLAEGVLEVKRVSDRLMAMKLEVKGSILNLLSAYSPQVNNSMEKKNCRRRRLKGIHSRSDTNRTGNEALSFYYPRLLHCLDQMLAVMSLSQHRVSSSKTVSGWARQVASRSLEVHGKDGDKVFD